MKKKLIISATIIVVLFLISSTSFADPPIQDYSGNAYNYFTTRTTSQELDQYLGYYLFDDCSVCYVTKPSGRVNCYHQSYVINIDDDNKKVSGNIYVKAGTAYPDNSTLFGGIGDLWTYYHVKMRVRNYQYYGQYQMHTEGQWQVY